MQRLPWEKMRMARTDTQKFKSWKMQKAYTSINKIAFAKDGFKATSILWKEKYIIEKIKVADMANK